MTDGLDPRSLSSMLDAQGASWQAADNPVAALSADERRRRLGYVPGPDEPSLAEQEDIAQAALAEALPAAEIGAPPAHDWRNVGGRSYVGPVRDQGGCGSCVAFGTAATMEGRARVATSNPGLDIDLSEAHLFFCIAAAEGRNCGNGWWPDRAFEGARTQGVVDEACFPYTDHDQSCALCAGWQQRVTKVSAWHRITSVNDMKSWLVSRGPLGACFNVYDDFFAYRSGVYRHVTGNLAGGHCVCVVGYDDAQGCWICKNSWGTGWGDGGFFRIAYGDCGIDSTMWAADDVVLAGPGAWSGWASLGGVLTSSIATARNADGRLELFVRGTDNALWHKWQTAPSNGWSGWESLGGVLTSNIAAARNADGRLELFVRGTDNALWHKWQTAPSNGWSGWESLGGVITTNIAVARNADGRLELFARGTDNALWHKWQTAPNNGWSGWESLGGVLTSEIAAAQNGDGRLELFVRGTDGAVWHKWQTAPSNGWSGWASLGGVITSNIAVIRNASPRLEIFARGTDNALWHKWQTAPSNGWSGWASLGGVLTSDTAAAQNSDGRLEVFVRGTDNALWHQWQTRAF